MQLNLPRLLPRYGLEHVRSLELMWCLDNIKWVRCNTTDRDSDHVAAMWDNFRNESSTEYHSPLDTLCAMIPETFPSLRSLHISFQSWLGPREQPPQNPASVDLISDLEKIFLGPIEKMIQTSSFEQPVEFNVAIQRAAWEVLMSKYRTLLGETLQFETVDYSTRGGTRGRFWKPLPGSDNPGRDVSTKNNNPGYWVCEGWDDIPDWLSTPADWCRTYWGERWLSGPSTNS